MSEASKAVRTGIWLSLYMFLIVLVLTIWENLYWFIDNTVETFFLVFVVVIPVCALVYKIFE